MSWMGGGGVDVAGEELRRKQVAMLAECGLNAAEIEEALSKVADRSQATAARASGLYFF
jgi:hypothetical protein